MAGYLFVVLAVLVAVAGWWVRHRLRHRTRSGVTDEIVHQIETLGHVDAEDVEPGRREASAGRGGRVLGANLGRT